MTAHPAPESGGTRSRGPRGPWVAVIPQRDITSAKSRLLLRPEARQAVVRAMFRDTVSAVRAASQVEAVLVVVDRIQDAAHVRSPGVVPLVLPGTPGMNAALREGGRRAREWWPRCRLAGLPADLPSLRSEDLDVALKVAGRHERTFVADRRREGTSLLTASEGVDLDPEFGERSRLAHLGSGAVETLDPNIESLRRDVDDLDDLLDAALGHPGAALGAVLRSLGHPFDRMSARQRSGSSSVAP
ncbi:2-phospho-L-lactate guanylyltransferase [Rhodococcus koreensis]|uniref:2-phospho-L-lactate guanylyltransferase n=1 Tax=Rhodococcus koreensis TaxID=99653 RepID=A0A1H4SZY6_9NOCA|nr:2-phospho-L-lactate guanylyltransferase [Rhodococcus koreensis]QSE82334.1 2-phospho-L-lactate guanylyltransferase [Rhodococcus koreensis]SEC49727.1 2-phospho-L-lactate guanylyltransferase [Rhodococcus koreensis]